MTKRECRKVAQKIADLEIKIKNAESKEEKYKYENQIMKLCSSFTDILDMMQIDEEIQNILESS